MPNQRTSQSPKIKSSHFSLAQAPYIKTFIIGVLLSASNQHIYVWEIWAVWQKQCSHFNSRSVPLHITKSCHVSVVGCRWNFKITSPFVCELYRETAVRLVKCVSEWTWVSGNRQGRPVLLWRCFCLGWEEVVLKLGITAGITTDLSLFTIS